MASATSRLEIGLAGLDATWVARLAVGGQLTIGGQCTVLLLSNVRPLVDDTIEVRRCGSAVRALDWFVGIDLGDRLLQLDEVANGLQLITVIA